jgi:hypothetical protein
MSDRPLPNESLMTRQEAAAGQLGMSVKTLMAHVARSVQLPANPTLPSNVVSFKRTE